MTRDMTFEVLLDADAVAGRVADWMLELALAASGPFAIALSGGTTPRAIYALLATPLYRERFPWPRAHWFWGDERFVPHDDPRSNYRMVWEAMLSHAPVPAVNIHPISVQGATPQQAALEYERALKIFYGADQIDPVRPLFEINLLGLGEDGHFASLFPGSDALNERVHWAAPMIGLQPEARITLTYPALESCTHAGFVVCGAAKAAILRRVRAGDPDLPASHFRPIGEMRIFADEAAAGERA
jgi:6-phosphogluconolactonase